jgi:hypothetical protein
MTTTVRFSNVRALRGTPVDQLVRVGMSSCDFTFKAGQRYLIVAHREADGRLAVGSCGLTRTIEEATGLLEYLANLDRPGAETLVWGWAVDVNNRLQAPIVVTPMPQMVITLRGPTTVTITTDQLGYFMLRGLPRGTYTASIRNPAPSGRRFYAYDPRFDLSADVALACAELRFETAQ